jgi:hypothetical protein
MKQRTPCRPADPGITTRRPFQLLCSTGDVYSKPRSKTPRSAQANTPQGVAEQRGALGVGALPRTWSKPRRFE